MSAAAPTIPPATRRAQRIATWVAATAIGLVIAASLDGWASRTLFSEGAADKDWGRALRVLGYLPLWLVVAIVLVVHDGRRTLRPPLRDRFTRGVLLLLSSGTAGLVAEACKLIFRRLRIGASDALWARRPFSDEPFNTAGLSMPSSHAAIAFGAAFMLWRLHPTAWPLWLSIGVGCGLQRILDRAHYVSDVYAAAIVALACSTALWAFNLAAYRRDQMRHDAP